MFSVSSVQGFTALIKFIHLIGLTETYTHAAHRVFINRYENIGMFKPYIAKERRVLREINVDILVLTLMGHAQV